MQWGSVTREQRKTGPDVWSYRWWDRGANGKPIHRRLTIGSVRKFAHKSLALRAISGLRLEINAKDPRMRMVVLTVAQLAEHWL